MPDNSAERVELFLIKMSNDRIKIGRSHSNVDRAFIGIIARVTVILPSDSVDENIDP
jgi:hypothetical protein